VVDLIIELEQIIEEKKKAELKVPLPKK